MTAVTILFLLLAAPLAGASPQRIVSGIPSATEMLFALGLGDQVVGVTTNCNYPPEAQNKPKVGGFTLNLERVVALKPDLVVLQADAQPREIERCRKMKLPVLALEARSIDGVIVALRQLGNATGRDRAAAELIGTMHRRLSAVTPRLWGLQLVLQRPRVLAVVGWEPLIVAGGGTFIDDILRRAGAENIAAGARGAYPQFSREQLLNIRPDYIIVPEGTVRRGELEGAGKWAVLYVDRDIISRPGPRVVEAVETIARFINEKKI